MTKLEEAMASIDKDFGAGAVQRLDDSAAGTVEVIPSGSLALDRALGIGGYPRGRIVEIYGPESSGKSTLCLHAAAQAQRAGGTVFFLDVEHSIDLEYARNLGVDTDQLLIAQPDTGEQALTILERLVKSGEVALVVIDSIAALVPRAELEGDLGDRHVGLHARLMSAAMRKLTGILDTTSTCSIWTNQIRERIGVVGYGGPSETTTGGRAMRFYASQRLDIRRIATEKQGDEAVGNDTRVKVVKNKLGSPHRIAEFTIRYGQGISRELELLDLGVTAGAVIKKGAWFSYAPEEGDPIQLGQGRENARLALITDPAIASSIEARIREKP